MSENTKWLIGWFVLCFTAMIIMNISFECYKRDVKAALETIRPKFPTQ